MSKDFRDLRRQRQGKEAPTQGITPVQPENVFAVTLPGKEAAPSHSETVEPLNSEEVEEAEDQVVKTSFYPKPAQLDKLDDLAAEYNRLYRRKRPRINRNHIVRFLIDLVDIEMLDDLNAKS